MGEKFTLGVAALGAHHNFQPRPLVDFRFYARNQIKVDIGDEQERFKGFYLKAVLAKLVPDLLKGNARPFADLRKGGGDVVAVFAHNGKTIGRAVVCQHLAFIVEDAPARGKDAFDAQAVVLRLTGKFFAPMNLKIPKAHHQHKKQQTHHNLKQDGTRARRLIALALDLNLEPGANALVRVFVFVREQRGIVSFPDHRGSSGGWPPTAARRKAQRWPVSDFCPGFPARRRAGFARVT